MVINPALALASDNTTFDSLISSESIGLLLYKSSIVFHRYIGFWRKLPRSSDIGRPSSLSRVSRVS